MEEHAQQWARRHVIDIGVEADPPAWLRTAVETVLADMQQPRPVRLNVSYRQRGDGTWLVDGAVPVSEDDDRAYLLVEIADHLQDQRFDQHEEAWGEARPACPGHTHPTRPWPDDATGIAWWACPKTHRNIARIGHYGEPRRSK